MHEAKLTDANSTSKTDSNHEFQVIEVIRDPDGVVAVITERLDNGRISFMLAREFELNGETRRSAYLNPRHLTAVRRLIADLEERLELAEDRAREKRRDRGGSAGGER